MMRKFLIGGLAALTFAVGGLAPLAEAQARDGRYYYRHRDRDDDGAAGIAGLAIGAALASGGNRRGYGYYDGYSPRGYYYDGYRRDGYYAPRYYRPGYAYGYGGRGRCRTTSYWDDWNGGYVERTRCW
jgi:hypothetical protein